MATTSPPSQNRVQGSSSKFTLSDIHNASLQKQSISFDVLIHEEVGQRQHTHQDQPHKPNTNSRAQPKALLASMMEDYDGPMMRQVLINTVRPGKEVIVHWIFGKEGASKDAFDLILRLQAVGAEDAENEEGEEAEGEKQICNDIQKALPSLTPLTPSHTCRSSSHQNFSYFGPGKCPGGGENYYHTYTLSLFRSSLAGCGI